jgi:hypothetical protein
MKQLAFSHDKFYVILTVLKVDICRTKKGGGTEGKKIEVANE